MTKLCSKCGKPRDREGQGYCRACHSAYEKSWRQMRIVKRLRHVYRELSAMGLTRAQIDTVKQIMEHNE